jgi:hypothetical protein
MDVDVPVPQAAENDHITIVWAFSPLTETNGRVGQLRVPESIARPLIDAGYVQEWSATDGQDLKYIEADARPPYPLKPSAITAAVTEDPPGTFTVSFGGSVDGVNALASYRIRNDADLWIVQSLYGQPAGTDATGAAGLFLADLQRLASDALEVSALATDVTIQGKPGTTVKSVEFALGINAAAAPAPEPPPPSPSPAPEPSPPPPPPPAPAPASRGSHG